MSKRIKLLVSVLLAIIVLLSFFAIRYFILKQYSYQLFLNGDNIVYSEVGSPYVDSGVSLVPLREDLIELIKTENNVDINKVGEYSVKYNLAFGNQVREVERKVIVRDTVAPELTINGNKEIYTVVNIKFSNPTYKAIDNYDGDITDKVKFESDVDLSKIGTYSIKYSVSDSSSNITEAVIVVHVEEKKDAYIDVSIKEQKLRYYEFGNLMLESDVVTGIYNKTPIGTYKVINKARNIILKGIGYASFVSYWIDFKDHEYGFHDASWRSKFGGTIYKTNGSHGCVNMPLENVEKLYNLVEFGTPVYIHE